jgi:hypothetical protein
MSRAALLALAVLVAADPWTAHADDAARAQAQRVADTAPQKPYVADQHHTTTGALERNLTMSGRGLEDGGAVRYIEVTAPFNLVNTRYLLFERPQGRDEQFLYVPTMQRVMRLSETTRREPFLGSTFYIVDLIQPAIDDFTYTFVGDETVQGRACRLIAAVPKHPDREFYARSVFAIDPTDLVVVRVALDDTDGEPFKVLHVDELERVEGHWTAMRQRMVNVRESETSTLVVERIDYDASVPDETFTVGHLGR